MGLFAVVKSLLNVTEVIANVENVREIGWFEIEQ